MSAGHLTSSEGIGHVGPTTKVASMTTWVSAPASGAWPVSLTTQFSLLRLKVLCTLNGLLAGGGQAPSIDKLQAAFPHHDLTGS